MSSLFLVIGIIVVMIILLVAIFSYALYKTLNKGETL